MEINNTSPEVNNQPVQNTPPAADFSAPTFTPAPAVNPNNMRFGLSSQSRSFITIVLLTLLGPVGLVPMWLWNDEWSVKNKVVITILTILPIVLMGLYMRYIFETYSTLLY